jgi:hypothetical protein
MSVSSYTAIPSIRGDGAARAVSATSVTANPVHRTALFSRDRRFRYRLGRRWGDGAAVCFVLLNPSTADETREDRTVRRCIGFARGRGYGALEVVNLYAYVATDPAELRRAGYPVGRYNDPTTGTSS